MAALAPAGTQGPDRREVAIGRAEAVRWQGHQAGQIWQGSLVTPLDQGCNSQVALEPGAGGGGRAGVAADQPIAGVNSITGVFADQGQLGGQST